ncbi:MAG UNVERIFIED_CONTAM: hypothetical protein LVT10_12020 [Anaerolineae bacterium]
MIALRESGASFRVRATLGIDLKHLSELSSYLADLLVNEDGTLDNETLNDQLKLLGDAQPQVASIGCLTPHGCQ